MKEFTADFGYTELQTMAHFESFLMAKCNIAQSHKFLVGRIVISNVCLCVCLSVRLLVNR